MRSGRTLLHIINAIAWACLLQWPWGGSLIPALGALALVHLAAPLLSSLGNSDLHRSFAFGPLIMFAVDVAFLVAAWKQDSWGDLTTVFVPVLAGLALLALAYSASVMSVFSNWRQRRD